LFFSFRRALRQAQEKPFDRPFTALRASAQDKLREGKSALHRAKDFSLALLRNLLGERLEAKA
jgi:hypothetical protein